MASTWSPLPKRIANRVDIDPALRSHDLQPVYISREQNDLYYIPATVNLLDGILARNAAVDAAKAALNAIDKIGDKEYAPYPVGREVRRSGLADQPAPVEQPKSPEAAPEPEVDMTDLAALELAVANAFIHDKVETDDPSENR